MTCSKRTPDSPLKVAVIGSGPSGFYAAEALLRSSAHVEIDMFERLPVPYGLVRSGVAPDHPKLKQVSEVFAGIGANARLRFFGNVSVGTDIDLATLRRSHHAVILACGAEADRELGIPGERLPGSHTATEFVGWYNGHPDFSDRQFDLSHPAAVVIGQGNVAADVSRILAKSCDELASTDIAEHALEVLRQSRVTDIYVVGRRGPAQASFTPKELREFGAIDGCRPVVLPPELQLNRASELELAERTLAASRSVYELFQGFRAIRPKGRSRRRVHFVFLRSPASIHGSGRVQSVRFEINVLEGEPFGQVARGTGKFMEIEAGLVLRSIGYRALPLAGVPFDRDRAVIPNAGGRVVDAAGSPVPGLYVTGWIKRGPTGIIGTNRADSVATVNALLEDFSVLKEHERKLGAIAVAEYLAAKGCRHVSFADWREIDRREIARGNAVGKPREKFVRVEDMLRQIA